VLQFAAVLLWFASLRPAGLCLDLSAISLLQWLAFLLLACYGQSLNVGIFQVNKTAERQSTDVSSFQVTFSQRSALYGSHSLQTWMLSTSICHRTECVLL
jgi:hypothetical protein